MAALPARILDTWRGARLRASTSPKLLRGCRCVSVVVAARWLFVFPLLPVLLSSPYYSTLPRRLTAARQMLPSTLGFSLSHSLSLSVGILVTNGRRTRGRAKKARPRSFEIRLSRVRPPRLKLLSSLPKLPPSVVYLYTCIAPHRELDGF